MIKSQLIQHVTDKHTVWSKQDITDACNVVFEQLTGALAREERVELRGFGAFTLRKRSAQTMRNPRTHQVVKLDERNIVYFRASKTLCQAINNNDSA